MFSSLFGLFYPEQPHSTLRNKVTNLTFLSIHLLNRAGCIKRSSYWVRFEPTYLFRVMSIWTENSNKCLN